MIVVINSTWFSKSEDLLPSHGDVYLNYLAAIGYDPEDPPLADLLRCYHHLEGDWLIVSPIYWQATHNDAQILRAGADLGWTDTQAQASCSQLAEFLAPEEINLHYHSPEYWLLRAEGKPPLTTKPIHQILNKPLMQGLQALDKTLYWQKFLTECQMFFASGHSSNVVNGLWIWGGSKLKKQSRAVSTDSACFPWVRTSQTPVGLYDPKADLKAVQVLVLDSLNELSTDHKKQLNNRTVTWYWNNTTYTTHPPYLIRIWRSLFHAH